MSDDEPDHPCCNHGERVDALEGENVALRRKLRRYRDALQRIEGSPRSAIGNEGQRLAREVLEA